MLPDCTPSHCPQCALRNWCDRPENKVAANLEMLTQKLKSIRDPAFKVI